MNHEKRAEYVALARGVISDRPAPDPPVRLSEALAAAVLALEAEVARLSVGDAWLRLLGEALIAAWDAAPENSYEEYKASHDGMGALREAVDEIAEIAALRERAERAERDKDENIAAARDLSWKLDAAGDEEERAIRERDEARAALATEREGRKQAIEQAVERATRFLRSWEIHGEAQKKQVETYDKRAEDTHDPWLSDAVTDLRQALRERDEARAALRAASEHRAAGGGKT